VIGLGGAADGFFSGLVLADVGEGDVGCPSGGGEGGPSGDAALTWGIHDNAN
jgi:hypothetical protein